MNSQVPPDVALLWEDLPVPMVALEATGVVTHASPAACRLLWRVRDEIEGRPLVDLLGPKARRLPADLHGRARRGGRAAVSLQRPFARSDGSEVWCRLSLWPVGEALTACALEPVSRGHPVEDLARTFERDTGREAPGWMAGGIAHDLQNVLSAVLVGDAPHEPSSLHNEAAARATTLGRRLASLAGPAAPPEDTDVNAAVRQLRALLQAALGARGILRFDLDEGLPRVRIAPGELDRALLNLAVNARNALALGGCLRIATSVTGNEVLVVVEDDGAGMEAAVRARVLEPLFTTRPPRAGSGLGLAVVRRIVADAGGTLAIESAPGVGTRVELRFPPAAGGAPVASPPAAELSAAGLRVLVVDDAPGLADVLAACLRDHDVHAVPCAGAREALAALGAADPPFDVLLTDVEMPGMGGRELAARARARHAGLRVVLMTCGDPGTTGEVTLDKPFCAADALRSLARARNAPSRF